MNLTLTIVHINKNKQFTADTGKCLQFARLSLSPFLKMGVTKAFFQSSGTWWDDRDYLLLRRELQGDY